MGQLYMESGQVDLTAGSFPHLVQGIKRQRLFGFNYLSLVGRAIPASLITFCGDRAGAPIPDDGTESRLSDSSGHASYACNGEAPVRIMMVLECLRSGAASLAQDRAYESAADSSGLTRQVESLDPFMVEHEFRDRSRDISVAHQR